jgi:hypothetical protein
MELERPAVGVPQTYIDNYAKFICIMSLTVEPTIRLKCTLNLHTVSRRLVCSELRVR